MFSRFSIRHFTLALMGAALITHARGVPTAEQMKDFLKTRPEADEIQWKDASRGEPFTVRLLDSSVQGLVVEKRLANGVTQRKLPLSEIGAIRITLTPEETDLLDHPAKEAAPALEVLWSTRKATLTISGSNAAMTGLAYAKALRAENTERSLTNAADVLNTIEVKATDDETIALAKSELEVLDFALARKAGNTEKADQLAWKIAENAFGENSDAMLTATDWLADRHFSQLKAIEEDNPRWDEDPDVKPARDRLYHLALDFALYPSLFESNNQSAAAAGLAKAARVYQFTNDNERLKGELEDLAALYPDSTEAKQNAELLDQLRQAEANGKLSQVESSSEDPTAEETQDSDSPAKEPPAPKRYSIFGE
ncbi:hypothetical protein JIN85_16185 [Luteolibacter pohnpeiensis]|uniref:Uncharacterized protein n=1 Tax=Luteolibacter pohnpeiensis TaxID=454153 RepID=A0A934SDN4_9BACT|nr:hypothetical protein [Luteolibacter pohnpeiensis]MBK1883959.1 hypothetical protein [Luteolibacter pohnpeiensis]